MYSKKTFYVWKCSHCEHRNKAVFNFHYNFPGSYNVIWGCSKCGNESYIKFDFGVYPITEKRGKGFYERYF